MGSVVTACCIFPLCDFATLLFWEWDRRGRRRGEQKKQESGQSDLSDEIRRGKRWSPSSKDQVVLFKREARVTLCGVTDGLWPTCWKPLGARFMALLTSPIACHLLHISRFCRSNQWSIFIEHKLNASTGSDILFFMKTFYFILEYSWLTGNPGGSVVKNLPAVQEKWVQSLGWEDPLEKGNGDPLQNSCLENSMDRRACQVIVRRIARSQTRLNDQTHIHTHNWLAVLWLFQMNSEGTHTYIFISPFSP